MPDSTLVSGALASSKEEVTAVEQVADLAPEPVRKPINLSPEPADPADVSALLIDRIARNAPCSLVRLSHCEAKFLTHPVDVSRKEINRSLKRQFGYTDLPEQQIIAISAMIKASARSCDVAGVPHFGSAELRRLAAGDEGMKLWSLVGPAAKRLDLFSANTLFPTVNIHMRLLDSNFLERVLSVTKSVTLVGCRDLRSNFQALGFDEVFHIPVPEAARTRGDTEVMRHYPEAFNQIVARIRSEQRQGVFFVGAGFLGKIYCHEIRLAGGVAIDMGSVMDLWAGVASRSGYDNIVEKFALKES